MKCPEEANLEIKKVDWYLPGDGGNEESSDGECMLMGTRFLLGMMKLF